MNQRFYFISRTVLWMVLAAASAQAAPEFWQSQSIYQLLTDRFFDANAANNNAAGSYNASNGGKVHGGDFKGVEQKLDYIKALGATAIWISPVVLNANGEYHGYAGRDFYAVDPHWGALSNLQSLVTAAHARGLLVINDIIVNHGGDLVYSTDSGYGNFKTPPAGYNLRYRNAAKQFAAPFNTNASNPTLASLFHTNGTIQDYNNTTQVELGELAGLDDFRTESAYVRSNMAAVYNYWIQAAGFDGFRIDTVKHCEMGFWQEWCPLVHAFAATNGRPDFFMFGEALDGSDAKCGSYTGTQGGGAFKLDSVLDYPLYFKINSVFATTTGNTKQIEDRYGGLAGNYTASAQSRLVTFLDNHDQTRFLNSANANGNTNRLAVALAFLYSARGIPCLYYGTEQAFNGGSDPANREDMFDGSYEQGPSLGDNFNETHPLFQLVAKLNNFRRLYPALQTGAHVNLWNDPAAPGLFAYARRLGGTQEVFTVFNTAAASQTLPNRPTLYPAGTTLVNLFDPNETLTVLAGPVTPPITVPGTAAKMFVAQSQFLPLDPVVTSASPAHDAASVSALTPLVLQFSTPMDTNSVQTAFTTTPATTGSFAWSAAGDTLTYTPNGSWPGLTLVTVRLAETARAAGPGNTFHAAFESRFTTANASDLIPPTITLSSPTNGSFVSGVLAISGTAADNLSVSKVEVRLDNGAWLTASGTTAWSFSLNTSNILNGTHTLAARATDAGGNFSATNSATVRFLNVPGAYLQRLAGGNAGNITDCTSAVWLRDQAWSAGSFGYTGGATGYVGNVVTGICAAAQSLYQRERFSTAGGGFRYWFDCPPGLYAVTLVEAETYWSSPGQRVFNAFIEGAQVLTNFDIFVAAGGKNLPWSRTFTNTVADGQLEILFTPVTDNARVSGLQVQKLGDLFSDSDGIPDWWRWAYFDHATGQAGDKSRASDDADGDGASNEHEFRAGTNPLDTNSVFRITRFLPTGGAGQIVWPTVSARTYQLQQSDALGAAAIWSSVGGVWPGTGGAVTQTVGAPTTTARYFRVSAQ